MKNFIIDRFVIKITYKNKIYVSVNNISQCDIVVEFKGKGSHSLSVSPKSRNFIMLEKGSYTISSDVCGAEYSSMKTLVKDMEISLTDWFNMNSK